MDLGQPTYPDARHQQIRTTSHLCRLDRSCCAASREELIPPPRAEGLTAPGGEREEPVQFTSGGQADMAGPVLGNVQR
jgi:hypothetical protein